MVVLVFSPDFGDLKNLKDHLVHLLGWQGFVPHSVFSSVLSHLIDQTFLLVLGDVFQNIIDLLVEKYFLICSLHFCWFNYYCHFAITSANYCCHVNF